MQHLLGGMSPETFLRDYWQKKPLLIRNGIPDFQSPIDRDELAGMAMEEDVESRLVRDSDGKYGIVHGPLSEDVLTTLTESHWTLLVQDVDKFIPEVAEYRRLVNFIPEWRMDDIMISFAADQGSVGPHVDLYDVFLLQAEGKRRWQIDISSLPDLTYDPDQQLRVLKTFSPTDEWILEPGDILYLPPGIPHHGVAIGACMTWSFGFRAPAFRDLSESIGAILSERWTQENLFTDQQQTWSKDAGEISRTALDQIRTTLLEEWKTADWDAMLGCILTGHKSNCAPVPAEPEDVPSAEELKGLLQTKRTLRRDPASRLAHIVKGGKSTLFGNGEVIATALPPKVAQRLCQLPMESPLGLHREEATLWVPAMIGLIKLGLFSIE